MAPYAAMHSYPVSIDFSTKGSVRSNFKRLIALNSLSIKEGQLNDIHAFESVTQHECNTVSLSKSDGTVKEFKIISPQGEGGIIEASGSYKKKENSIFHAFYLWPLTSNEPRKANTCFCC